MHQNTDKIRSIFFSGHLDEKNAKNKYYLNTILAKSRWSDLDTNNLGLSVKNVQVVCLI